MVTDVARKTYKKQGITNFKDWFPYLTQRLKRNSILKIYLQYF